MGGAWRDPTEATGTGATQQGEEDGFGHVVGGDLPISGEQAEPLHRVVEGLQGAGDIRQGDRHL